MKKIFSLFIAVMLVLSISAAVFAEEFPTTKMTSAVMTNTSEPISGTAVCPTIIDEPTPPAFPLFTLWDTNGCPDDVGGIYPSISTSGYNPQDPESVPGQITIEYMIYIVRGTSEERKAEITALANQLEKEYAESTGTERKLIMRFIECTLSERLIWDYRAKLEAALGKLTYAVGVAPSKDDIGFIVYYRNDSDLDEIKSIIEDNYPELINLIEFCLGDPDELTDSGGIPEILPGIGTPSATADPAGEAAKHPATFFFIGLSVIVAAALAFYFIRLRSRAAVLSSGETVMTGTPSAKEVKRKIKESASSPSESVIDNIYKKM